MAQEGPVDVVVPQADNAIVRDVDADEFRNMKLSIGALGRQAIFEVSLSGDSLNDTRSIDIRLRQNNNGGRGPQPTASDAVAPPAPPDQHAPAAGEAPAAPLPAQGRLKITVAAEEKDDADKDDREYLDKMRGWLMAVATLFVNMAFQAALHPPDSFKTEWYYTPAGDRDSTVAAPAPSTHAASMTAGESSLRAFLYLFCNIITFTVSLTVAQVLLWETSSPRRIMRIVRLLMAILSFTAACTFALGSSHEWVVTRTVIMGVLLYAAMVVIMRLW